MVERMTERNAEEESEGVSTPGGDDYSMVRKEE